ncbi:hypothetical protein QYE76_015544 [Lolium multiflorum]|uniref:Arabidopsis retrotransposon Orf1 C-terminal domain-containing protein n=1 Tax=Lolium multiflorum TaxID=4521 RepID=A0AAD8U760_LOLMU|nr:hypothetical protein QYE76_015544 [Lolium multiflorum]
MGKPRDTKVAILPSTTRKGTTLSTSAALDSPSVISKLVSPPQTSNAGTSAESENCSYNFGDASAVLDDSGSLGSFLDATIARSRQIENIETPNENAATPVNSPESVEYSSDDLDEDYVELDDDFIDKCNATTAIRVPQWGSCEKVRGLPQELLSLYKMIFQGRSFSYDSGKISSIQLTAIRYFAYFITKCVLARKNANKLSIQDLAFLAAALQCDRTYNLGALIAYRLATNREKGGICGGLIASRLLAMHGVEPHHLDIQLSMEKLDIVSMIKHDFVSDLSNLSNLSYKITFYKKTWRTTKKTERLVVLPAPVLFNLDSRKDWSVTEGELNAYIEGDGHHAGDSTEEAEEHLDLSSDAASSSCQHFGPEDPSPFSSAPGPYYDHAMYDPPAWNPR